MRWFWYPSWPRFPSILHNDFFDVENDVESIIIPLPDKIYLLGEDVFAISKEMFATTERHVIDETENKFIDHLIMRAKNGNPIASELVGCLSLTSKNPMILRIYFIRSVEFKEKIRANEIINNQIKNTYLLMDMPRFIWVAEISTYKIFSETQKIVGEILFDSTANKFDYLGAFLSAHLPGTFFMNDRIYHEQAITYDDLGEEDIYEIVPFKRDLECVLERRKD